MTIDATRIVHVGIDGGSFKILDRLAERGLMPEYGAIKQEGGHATLRSTTPWFTVPAWISWMTGVAAERHGRIYWTATAARDYWERGGAAGRFVASTDVDYASIFRILSNAGRRVASVNMPVTYPPPAVNGVVVSGFLAPLDANRTSHPAGFLARYPDYRIDVEEGPDGGPIAVETDEDVARYIKAMTTMALERHRVFSDLLREPFDLASVVYVGADRISHVAWPQLECVLEGSASTEGEKAIESYYSTLDRILGEVRRTTAKGILLVTSDHGQGPPPSRVIAPNVWLMNEGWLVPRGRPARRASHLLIPASIRRRIWGLYRRRRNLPLGAAPFVDWQASTAYAIPMPHCRAIGVAVRGDRAQQREIASRLENLFDAQTGERPIERILFTSDICTERAASTYPELVVLLSKEFGAVGRVDGPLIEDAPVSPSGYHEPDGMLLAVGDGVMPGEHAECSICDIAPTILTLGGIGPLQTMDGSVIRWLTGAADNLMRVAAEAETRGDDGLRFDEEEDIAEHLRALGYID